MASLREEAARQRSMRMGGMDKEAHALQQEVAGLTQQLQRQQMEAGEARGALLRAWQEERGELLRQFEEEAAASRREAEGLAQRLRRRWRWRRCPRDPSGQGRQTQLPVCRARR